MSEQRAPEERIWTPSNVITITRILLVPLFVAALLTPWPDWFGMNSAFSNSWKSIVAAVIFIVISCTDWVDGYLARSRNEVTDFGKFMDPLADKILVTAALIALVELGDLPTWVVLVILAREFIVSGMRMMAASKGVVIAASMLGKFKTVFQMIAIVLFTVKGSSLFGVQDNAPSDMLWVISWVFMAIALVLTIASMIDYLVKGRQIIGFGPAGNSDEAAATRDKAPSSNAGPESRIDDEALAAQAQEVVHAALERHVTMGTAESLTGGMIGSFITSVPGSSDAYRGGVVSYTNGVKHDVLQVNQRALDELGAVSEQVACQMAEGARSQLNCDIAVSVTGIAGPGGAEPGKPVGTVWMGVSNAAGTSARMLHFDGSRDEVRRQTTAAALEALRESLRP